MLILKLLAPILMFVVSLLQLLWGKKWRTEPRRAMRFGLPFFLCLLALITVLVVWQDDKRSNSLQDSLEGVTKQNAAAEKENRSDRKLLQDKIDNLQKTLDPFLKIAETRHPNVSSEAALAHLAKEIETLTKKTEQIETTTQQVASRDHYRPLTGATKTAVVQNIRRIAAKYGGTAIVVSISSEIGSQNRQHLAKELSEILKSSSLQVEGPQYMSTYPSTRADPLPPIAITCNPSDWTMAAELVKAWQPFLKARVQGKKSDAVKAGHLSLTIWGDPLFEQDGSVSFK
jgi:hypothetical protein